MIGHHDLPIIQQIQIANFLSFAFFSLDDLGKGKLNNYNFCLS